MQSQSTECAVCLIEGKLCTYCATVAFRVKLEAERGSHSQDHLFNAPATMPGQTALGGIE